MKRSRTTNERILNRIQQDLPVDDAVFSLIGDDVDSDGVSVINCIKAFKEEGIIRNIAGIFNPLSLGYSSCLVAFKVDEENIERVVDMINAHPGVSHNYLRDHTYNIWFTLAAESDSRRDAAIKRIADKGLVTDYLLLHTEQLLKIGVMFTQGDTADNTASITNRMEGDGSGKREQLSPNEQETVRILQNDLPLTEKPFSTLLRETGSTLPYDSLTAIARDLKETGVLRRYSAVLRHGKAGYTSNAMTVWRPGMDNDIKKIGEIFISEGAISHLYLRTIYPGRWDYPLFAMIHARDDATLRNIIDSLSQKSGIKDYQVLRTLKEFKKERVTYFSKEFARWEKEEGI